jgi:phospholipid/cholesterol/gamma-HCH transport system substrate-binding protein
MRGGGSSAARAATAAALVVAVAVTAIVLFGAGGSGYTVKARFINAGQIVKGNPVQSGGVAIGSVKEVGLAPNGDATVVFSVDGDHSPLPVGTRAAIRQSSLSGIANRYVDLTFPSERHGHEGGNIPDGGEIVADRTTTQVDLDQVFNTLDAPTRRNLQRTVQETAQAVDGRGKDIGRGFHYLDPALSTTSRLFDEASRDTPNLKASLHNSSRLLTALSERDSQLAALVGDLSTTTRALGSQKQALAESIGLLPPVMRRANTTFVNLRLALNDVDPLVNATKPLLPKLRPVFSQTRGLVAGARPTLRDLRLALSRPGAHNDLIELLGDTPALNDIATTTRARTLAPGRHNVSVGTTPGAFPQTARALKDATPVISLARPYTTDFLGWLDDFSTTGGFYDALGASTRVFISLAENITGHPPKTEQFHRCPGAAEVPASDGSNVLSADEQKRLGCTEADRAIR